MVVYFLIAPFTYHPDTKLVLYYPILNDGKVWDIYTYLDRNKDDAPKFHYPPMHFWVLKAELPLVKLIGGNKIVDWLKIGGNIAFKDDRIYLYNLATKFPLIILVLLSGFLIFKTLVKNGLTEKVAKRATMIWFFNPITLYSAIIMGQNDILAIFPFLLGLYFYYDLPILAFVLFGMGGSIKNYPLIWAIMLALVYPKKKFIDKIGLVLIPIFFYVATIFPFLKFEYFKNDVMLSGLSTRIFDSFLDIGMGDKLLIVPTLLVSLAMIGIKNKLSRNIYLLNSLLATSTLLILGFTHFHPQWFIWMMPFVSVLLAISAEWWWFVVMLPALSGIILLFNDKYLYWGLFSPINSNLVNLPYINEMLTSRGIDGVLLNNLCHSIIAGVAVYWFIVCCANKKVFNKK